MAFAIATALTDARAVIDARVTATWVTDCGQPETTIRWGNAGLDPPSNDVYLRVTVLPGESIETIGVLDVKPGLIQFDFFGVKNRGDAQLLPLCDKFKAKFQRADDGTIHFYGLDGPRDQFDPARSRQVMRVRFQYTEQHP